MLCADRKTSKRIAPDRRKCPTPIISRYTFFEGQRKKIRREKDKNKHLFVDLYSARLLVIVMSLLFLSCADAYMTLTLIEEGKAVEANPIMAYFLGYGILPFTTIKFIVTAVALVVLCMFKNVNIARIGLPITVKIYLLVVMYELYLLII